MRIFLKLEVIMLSEKFDILKQYLAPQHALSHLAGWLSERRWKWFKNWQIHYLTKRYNVDLQAAASSNIDDYPTFNSFFTRALKPGLRPIVQGPDEVASPADGAISQIGHINDMLLLQAKGFTYTLQNLLGGQEKLAHEFQDGSFATIYLAPKDYHRVHMPFKGILRETLAIPGKLFSVNQLTARSVPNLFARNERLICIFDTDFGPMAVILVGAMLVGSIQTVWGANTNSGKITHTLYTKEKAITLQRGDELGHFKMGSTVIVLFPSKKIRWSSELTENSSTEMGKLLGNICSS